jgi:hypothetical protein
MSLVTFVTVPGYKIQLDTSEEACSKFQISDKNGNKFPAKPGMKVIHSNQPGFGFIKGVAFCSGVKGGPFLWASFDVDEGMVGYSQNYVKV